LFPTGM